MEAGYLNFHDEEHFSDFSLVLDQNLMGNAQDLLMRMVENDFNYVDTHADRVTASTIWVDQSQSRTSDMLSGPDVSRINASNEDYAKVLTDWQEHLQVSDMDDYLDIVGINMNTNNDKNFYPEPVTNIESMLHIPKDDLYVDRELDEAQALVPENIYDILMSEADNIIADESKQKNKSAGTKGIINKAPAESETNIIQVASGKSKCRKTLKTEKKKDDKVSSLPAKQKKRKRLEKSQDKQDAENEDCIDVETVLGEVPVLEAGDVKSLLEQFEASEKSVMQSVPAKKAKKELNQSTKVRSNKQQISQEPCQLPIPKVPPPQTNLHKNIRDSLPKEVIDRIKASGERKKVISVIPAKPNTQAGSRNNGTRMQEAASTLSRNKLLKIVANNNNMRRTNGGSVQLDHDYCSSAGSHVNSGSRNSAHETGSSYSDKVMCSNNSAPQQLSLMQGESTTNNREYWTDGNSKKDSGLESGELSDSSEEQGAFPINNSQAKKSNSQTQNNAEDSHENTVTLTNSIQRSPNNAQNTSKTIQNKPVPVHEMKIRSALATSILQLRKGVLTTTKSVGQTKQMVSVLKKPPNCPQIARSTGSPNESIVTTTNSANNAVQNIIIQHSPEPAPIDEAKKPRKKLNLAEYRSRREQYRSDSSRTNSPIQPMTLIYVHHASTTTEPIKEADNLVWSEREIVSVLKPKADLEEEKTKPKPLTCEVAIQTYETVFEFPTRVMVDVDERNEEQRPARLLGRAERPYRKRRTTTSSSRSSSRSSRCKSRSRSRSKNRTRNRNRNRNRSRSRSRSRNSRSRSRSRNRSRSRSRSRSRNRSRNRSRSRCRSRSRGRSRSKCRSTRRRRLNSHHSSVSSRSSWSSRSRSRTRSSLSSRSRYSHSRSRSYRSRSSSRSRSRARTRTRSISRSISRSRFRSRSRSVSSSRYSSCSRSPSNAYRKAYDNWYDKEKQRQVEERRVIYVGRLDETITKADLRRRFEAFGPVVDISVHFREHGDNYGFVTFAYKNDAYAAVEHGNDDPNLPRYDLCFGGRRAFCKVKYADLDGMANGSPTGSSSIPQRDEDNTFDLLLKEAKAKLRKRKV